MSEETTVSAPSVPEPVNPAIVLAEGDGIVQQQEAPSSMFADEGQKRFSETELMEGEASEAPVENITEPPPPKGDEPKEAAATEEKPPEAPKEDEKDPVVKATAGLRRDLVEERAKRHELAEAVKIANQKIAELEQKVVATGKAEQPAETGTPEPAGEATKAFLAKNPGFNVLSQEEEDTLIDEDVAASQRYLLRKAEYEKALSKDETAKAEKTISSQEYARQVSAMVSAARSTIAADVPGIYDEGSDIGTKLYDFAVENGADGDYIAALTDPATYVQRLDGNGQYAGKYASIGAASLIKMIHTLYNKTVNGTAEREAQLRQEVTKELMEKIKQPGFRSIGEAPSATTIPDDTGQTLTEDDFRKMDDEKRRKYLGG